MKTILLVVFIMVYVAGCTSSVDPGPVNNYPLTKNNTWSYNALASLTNFRPIHPGITFRDTTITWLTSVRTEGRDTLLDSIETWKFTSRDTGAVNSIGVQHYLVHGDTLLLFAYYNPSLAFPKRSSGYRFTLEGRQYASIDELVRTITSEINIVDTLFAELYPPPVLIFPLTVGKEWTYRHVPFLINKKIIGTENVTTPAGNVACYKVQWFWDMNADGKWDSLLTGFDDINNQGLIKRSFEIKGIGLLSSGSPDPVGYIDLKYEYLINSVEGSLYPAALNKK